MPTKSLQKVVLGGLTVFVGKTPPNRVQLVEGILDDAIQGSRLLDGLGGLERQDASTLGSSRSSI